MLRMVDEMLARRSIARGALAAVAFEAGPGAFTSLRVSCSVAQGLAFGLGLPLIPVGTLEALAIQGIGRPAPGRYPVVVAIDARMNEVYACSLVVERDEKGSPGVPCEISPPRVGPGESLADWIDVGRFSGCEVLTVGEVFERNPALEASLHDAGLRTQRALGTLQPLRAETIASLARPLLYSGARWDPADAAPRYVRDKVALDRDEQQQQRLARSRGRGDV
jgi:tRNA threonylcarbamoyladenosine biosynthesis protein TsaB